MGKRSSVSVEAKLEKQTHINWNILDAVMGTNMTWLLSIYMNNFFRAWSTYSFEIKKGGHMQAVFLQVFGYLHFNGLSESYKKFTFGIALVRTESKLLIVT